MQTSATKLYVGGLDYGVNDENLADYFGSFGEVRSARVIIDRSSGQSKGYGFVELLPARAAQDAIRELNGKDFLGRTLSVRIANSSKRPITQKKTS
jgi:RNA recognition motif-containing protein